MPNYSQNFHSIHSLPLETENDSHLSNTTILTQNPAAERLNQEPQIGFDEFAMISVGLLFILSLFYLIFRKRQPNPVILTPVYSAEELYVRSPGIPCRHCHYFHPNLHLQCAVHPDIVLKRQATQCKDFTCRKNKDVAA